MRLSVYATDQHQHQYQYNIGIGGTLLNSSHTTPTSSLEGDQMIEMCTLFTPPLHTHSQLLLLPLKLPICWHWVLLPSWGDSWEPGLGWGVWWLQLQCWPVWWYCPRWSPTCPVIPPLDCFRWTSPTYLWCLFWSPPLPPMAPSCVLVGSFTTRAHHVSGTVHFLDERTVMLTQFIFDSNAPGMNICTREAKEW